MKDTSLKILLLLFLFEIIAVCRVQSQNMIQTEDSLRLLLEQTSIDSIKIDILTQLATLYDPVDRVISNEYYKQALEYEMDDSRRALILNTIGFYSWGLGNFNKAIDFYQQSLLIYTELNDSARIGLVTNNIAAANWTLGKWNDALRNYQAGLKIRKAINDKKGVSTILNNIGLLYQDWGMFDEAITRHNEALDIATEIDDYKAISYSYSNIGICYNKKREFESALKYQKLGFKIYSENGTSERNNSYYLANIGIVYEELGKIDSALFYFNKSLEEAKRINNEHRIAIAEYNLGKTYLNMRKIEIASRYINSSYRIALDNNYQGLLKDNQFALAEIEEFRGNVKLAYSYFKNASVIKDSMFNKEEIAKFTELTIRQNQENEEQEKALLRENIAIQQVIIHEGKIKRWLITAGGFLILLALIYIARSRESIKKLNLKLRKSEKELKQSNADKDKFFSIISHDLKSPFNAILGIADILDSKYDELPTTKIKQLLQMQKISSSNAYNLLDDLLQWAQTQTGRMKYSFDDINLYESVENVKALLDTIAFNKGVTINNLIKESATVIADKKAIETVLRNLISNAIKFTPSGGKVTVNSETKGNKIFISIIDTGTGITEEVKNSIFEDGFYHSTPGTNKEAGTGLGIYLCKEFIENHGGQIWVESKIGEGSKFTFSLPNKLKTF